MDSSTDDMKNEKDTRDNEEGTLNADNNNIDDDSHDECGAELNHGGHISHSLSSSRLLAHRSITTRRRVLNRGGLISRGNSSSSRLLAHRSLPTQRPVLNRGGLISRGNSSSRLLAQRSLPNDTFSFIFISKVFSIPFLIAIIVFSFQIAIFSLVSVDVIDMSYSSNPFNIPTNVESTVRATQVLAIIIAIVTQDDVKKVILILRDGYDADVFQGTFGPDATKFKWVLSLVLRASEGLIGLFVTFMLIMQSKTVLDLLLNFSAMEFVSLLDDVIFLMLRQGYFGVRMMNQATLCETKYYVPHALSIKSSRLSAVYFIIIFAVMFSGWSGIFTNQAQGKYLCQRMYIQVGDEFAPALAGLSGIYTINNNEQFGGRVTSSQENNGQGKIGYCEDKNVWTLKIQEQLMPYKYDPCLYWVAKSSESFDFDVTKTTSSQWYGRASSARQGSRHAYIVDVELICASCNDDTNECLNGGICRTDGTCDCRNNATGDWCQVQPTHNGHCDTYYNRLEFEYDGGDCCESTCISTDKYTCGKDEYGIVDIGYPHCNTKTEPYDQWFQSGNPVSGVNVDAESGISVALVGRGGTVLAVGDPGAAVVRLFDKDGSKWVQRGETLKGTTDSGFGYSISLSSGESNDVVKNDYSSPTVTLAVGALWSEFVQVYECQTSGCEQVGGDIILEVNSVSLSRDGNRLAIGTSTNANSFNPVEVYELDLGQEPPDWKMIGNMTEDSPPANQSDLFAEAEYYYYHPAILSGNGQVLVTIKIKINPVSNTNGTYDAELSYITHKWNSTIGSWEVMDDKGGLLFKTQENQFASFDVEKCFALSDDGTVLAVCSELAVYSWNLDKSSWIPRDVIFDPNTLVSSVDISADGSTLAIGSDFSVLALKWNGTHYTQHLNSILFDNFGTTISLSRDGNAMAVGRPLSGGGVTTVYKTQPAGCMDNKKLLRISFTTGDYPYENRWTLHIGNDTIQSQPYDGLPLMTFVKEMCVPNLCIKFRVFDNAGDGMQVLGGYSVILDGEEVASGGSDFSYVVTKHITGNCDCPAGLSRLSIMAADLNMGPDQTIPMEWALSYQNSTLAEEYVFNRTMDHKVELFEECIPEGCWHLTNPQCHARAFTTVYYNNDDDYYYNYYWWYNITYKGWSKAKDGAGDFCPEGNETISFGECLPGENVAVDYRTASPTTSISPTSSSSPTYCTGNTPDWVDGDGDGCDWYKENDLPGCEVHGAEGPAEDGSTAKESCCYCFLSNNPIPSPSITSSASPTTVQSPPSTG